MCKNKCSSIPDCVGFFQIVEDPNNVETEFDVGECVFQADTLAIDSTATPTRACERILKEVNVRTDSFWRLANGFMLS